MRAHLRSPEPGAARRCWRRAASRSTCWSAACTRGGAEVSLSAQGVRPARLLPAPPEPGALARADPERGVGLRLRSGHERRRGLRGLPAPQARAGTAARRRSTRCARSATGSPTVPRLSFAAPACARGSRSRSRRSSSLAVGVTFVVIYRGTGSTLRAQVDRSCARRRRRSRARGSGGRRTPERARRRRPPLHAPPRPSAPRRGCSSELSRRPHRHQRAGAARLEPRPRARGRRRLSAGEPPGAAAARRAARLLHGPRSRTSGPCA